MKKVDIEKINRKNFKSLMNALANPSSIHKINPLFDSYILAVGMVLLYSEVSFYAKSDEDFSLLEAMNNTFKKDMGEADYIFSDDMNLDLLKSAKIGSDISPEFSSTLIFSCKDFSGLHVNINGAGIDGEKEVILPINEEFIKVFNQKNSSYPKGNEVFFLSKKGEIQALSRTTKIRSV